MGSAPHVFITGASGLLGKHLVQKSLDHGIRVLGQYHRRKPAPVESCLWLQGDFSSLATTGKFLNDHSTLIKKCDFLINNYGPITSKAVSLLTAEDFMRDFTGNVLIPHEIIRYFLSHAPVKSIINLGFDGAGSPRSYRKILTYAMAKQNLLSLTLSLAGAHQQVCFNMVSPGTMEGAAVKAPGVKPVPPDRVASETVKLLLSGTTGQNIIIGSDR